MGTEAVVALLEQLKADYLERVLGAAERHLVGGPDLEGAFDREARELPKEIIEDCRVANAGAWGRAKAKRLEIPTQPKPEPEIKIKRRKLTAEAPQRTETAEQTAERIIGEKIKFHQSDHAPTPPSPPTIEEQNKALDHLAEIWDTNPIAYHKEQGEWAKKLFTTREAIDKAVRIIRERQVEKNEQSQATKLVAIGLGENVRLWRSPERQCYAAVRVNEHWENHSLESTGFAQWISYEYGRRNVATHDGEQVPQVPGAGSMRDAIGQLKGYAQFKGQTLVPATRVGGDEKEIWIDLGDDEWNAVRVTAGGWTVERDPAVSFVRGPTMAALPEPVRGGSVDPLRKLVSVRKGDFVLLVGWLIKALHPLGNFPIANISGPSEAGKSTTARMMLRCIDPTTAVNRRASRKVEDVLIAARNNWAISLDNLSFMTIEFSDVLCMISTGISSGTRAHYTNDEEHLYTVMRPVIFNGIPGELTERPDLASRSIKLQIVPMPASARRSDLELRREFEEAWPEIFGALCDGLVGAMRDGDSIHVDEPARMFDFERFAEAGCRAIGFRKWEFVEAYAANRKHSLLISLNSSEFGQAVVKFMEKHPEGFYGTATGLLNKLATYQRNRRGWPPDPQRLTTYLDRLLGPLNAAGIVFHHHLDNRTEGAGQKDIELKWKPKS